MALDKQLFARRLKMGRTEKGLTQEDLAAQIGMNVQTLQSYETCKRVPNIETVCTIADLYGWPIDYLIGRESEVPTTTR